MLDGGLARASKPALGTLTSGHRGVSAIHIPQRIVLDLLALMDLALVVAAAVGAKALYISTFLGDERPLGPYLLVGSAGGIISYYMLRSYRLHERAAIIDWRSRWRDIPLCVGAAFLILIVAVYLCKVAEFYSREWMLTWLALAVLLVLLWRVLAARLFMWFAASGSAARKVAVVMVGAERTPLLEGLAKVPGVSVVCSFSLSEDNIDDPLRKLIAIGGQDEIDEIVIASAADDPCLSGLVDRLGVLPVPIWLSFPGIGLPIYTAQQMGNFSLLEVKPRPIGDWGRVGKLIVDCVFGTVALVLFGPMMVLIALAIRLDSPGPALFRQRRHGYNHRVIDIFKFRTMYIMENESEITQASNNDVRVTRIGRWLRRTSLDELPQLLNVLSGEMSLVGPRPHALAHNEYYSAHLSRYGHRHIVKPGMTGLAQINGLRGGTADPELMRKRVQMDLCYIENWSLWLDLKILALTPLRGFWHHNAY